MPSSHVVIEYKALHPSKFLVSGIINDIKNVVKHAEAKAYWMLWDTAATWTHHPVFHVKHESHAAAGAKIHMYSKITIYTDSEPYVFVDKGTKPHYIEPNGKFAKSGSGRLSSLRFQPGYKAKTRPNHLRSGQGGHYGPYIHATAIFRHPGIAPRNFTVLVAKAMQKWMPHEVQKKINQGLAREIKQ